jgi:hypothetical protein
LQNSSPAQIRAIDEALRRDYKTTLKDQIDRIAIIGNSEDELRAEFLASPKTPRDAEGRVPDAYIQAYELMRAVDGSGTNEARLFRALEKLSKAELSEVAEAFHKLYPGYGEPGIGGFIVDKSGARVAVPLKQTALYHRLFSDLNTDVTIRRASALGVQRSQVRAGCR